MTYDPIFCLRSRNRPAGRSVKPRLTASFERGRPGAARRVQRRASWFRRRQERRAMRLAFLATRRACGFAVHYCARICGSRCRATACGWLETQMPPVAAQTKSGGGAHEV